MSGILPANQVPDNQNVEDEVPSQEDLNRSYETAKERLLELLGTQGQVSSRQLYRDLSARGVTHAEHAMTRLRAEGQGPEKTWRHYGRSFYTPPAFESVRAEQEKEEAVESAPIEEQKSISEGVARTPSPSRTRDQEEQRMCSGYIKPYLQDLYDSIHAPDEVETVFDVQLRKPSSEWRNVDLLAVDWRSKQLVELVTVEAKLAFTASAVMQAANYRRFSHRVWLAVRVQLSDGEDPHTVLRDRDPLLFDHAISLGLGILVCQIGRGRKYQVTPVNWPARQEPSEFERATFLEHYRDEFEKACILTPITRLGRVA